MRSLLDKIEQLFKQKIPFVSYKKPMGNLVSLMVQQDNALYLLKDYKQKGFVFAPFDNQRDIILFPLEKCKITTVDISGLDKGLITKNKVKLIPNEESKLSHIKLVKKGIEFIKEGKVKKVVLSRKEEVSFGEIQISELFSSLINTYPLAFISVCYHPMVGLWIGATPETLLSVNGTMFKTMSLAGTQQFNGIEEVEWAEKEKEEQQIVTDFILNELESFHLNVSDTFTKKAGSLLHICTEITGELKSNDQLEYLIHKLHPTPAVCGFPKENAKSFILQNENYDREFYAGFLGELNINNACDLFVNLRCMQINGKKANLFVGGGITIDSDPEKEWEETVAKSRVMKRVLK